MTVADIEVAIADEPDEVGMAVNWSKALVKLSQSKAVLNMHVDYE